MFAYINGFLEDVTVDNAVIDVNGFGINVRISADTASRLPGIGEQVRLYTYTYVKEDAFLLYGFLSRSDLEMFKLCITVSGIGPKGALAILSVMDADSLRFAIMSGDAKAISKAPGVGTRTAQRLILELKDKISIDDTLISREIAAGGAEGILTAGSLHIDSEKKKEAVEALVALGYGGREFKGCQCHRRCGGHGFRSNLKGCPEKIVLRNESNDYVQKNDRDKYHRRRY